MQKAGVHTNVSAGAAHWQLGRTEAHGKILKGMLTRMDSSEPIVDDDDFTRALRAAVHAKNSLSRIKGFTPEQAVLGKMARLPGSLISDNMAASHALAESDLPEGVAFRRDLQRREQASIAFIQADNDNSYRRALLRRSRPQCTQFEKGDWVLYWRRQKAGSRGERGRWYSPGHVICGDRRVVWVSHCGQLIRAAPEQLRSASLREWHAVQGNLTDDSQGAGTEARARQVVDLVGNGGFPTREEVEAHGETSQQLPDTGLGVNAETLDLPDMAELFGEPEEGVGEQTSQPEMEVSPAVSQAGEPGDTGGPEVSAAETPLPDEDLDDVLFGDGECFFMHPGTNQVWEIQLDETDVRMEDLPSPEQAMEYVLLATPEQKKCVEVKLWDLTSEEQTHFFRAKDKEIKAWLDHRTVRRVSGGTFDDSQLMLCRWVLTWGPGEAWWC